jgi:NADH-quinone oxidoreductase subunit F
LGKDIQGSGFDLEVVVHSGAGAYICGEETALLDSLEGFRGQPRLKPPFPAVAGLYASPTVVNNVETIASVPAILVNGAQWYKSFGSEKSPGIKLFAVSGHVERPGIYEAPMGTTMRELLEWSGGIRSGHELKFWVPGGSSVPLLTEEHLDVPYTYEDIAAAGSMLGTGTPMVFDETTSVTRTVTRWLEFYKHESCGKCTPCREGTYWLVDMLRRLESGVGSDDDIAKINDVSSQIAGRSFCALGDAAATPFPSAIKYFSEEIAQGTHTSAADLFDPVAATIFSGVNV